MKREISDEDHEAWLARNRHLLSYGHILALGEKLTDAEQKKFEAWYKERDSGSKS